MYLKKFRVLSVAYVQPDGLPTVLQPHPEDPADFRWRQSPHRYMTCGSSQPKPPLETLRARSSPNSSTEIYDT